MNPQIIRVGLVLVLAASFAGCIEPKDRRPGMRLTGEVASEVVTDWSFTNEHQEVLLETQTWYGIPHSVTTVCAGQGDKLYVPSVYFEGGAWGDKFWNRNVARDPNVRMKLGDKIYPLVAVVVDDPAELQSALGALAAKYPLWKDQLSKPEAERFDMAMVRMEPRES